MHQYFGQGCKNLGVDLNRNYGFQWGEGSQKKDPCIDETYKGPHAFSEPETMAMKNFIT